MSTWNFACVWETVAAVLPGADAQVQGPRRLTWRQFDERAEGLVGFRIDAGLGHQANVAQHLYNRPRDDHIEDIHPTTPTWTDA